MFTNAGKSVANYDTGVITSYALYIILGLISFIFLLFAPLLFTSLIPSSSELGDSVSVGTSGLILLYLSTLMLLPLAKRS